MESLYLYFFGTSQVSFLRSKEVINEKCSVEYMERFLSFFNDEFIEKSVDFCKNYSFFVPESGTNYRSIL